MNKLLIVCYALIVFNACNAKENSVKKQFVRNSNVSQKDIKEYKTHFIDLDKCKSVLVDFDKVFINHNISERLNESDTLQISKFYWSIKTTKFIEESEESKITYSSIKILNNKNHCIFEKDSILNVGMYYSTKMDNLLAIPLINEQQEDFVTVSTLYLYDNTKKCSIVIDDNLINCMFALITPNNKYILYNNSDKLFKYNIELNKKELLFEFDQPTIAVFKISFENDKLFIFHVNDFSDYPDIKMYKTYICDVPRWAF